MVRPLPLKMVDESTPLEIVADVKEGEGPLAPEFELGGGTLPTGSWVLTGHPSVGTMVFPQCFFVFSACFLSFLFL
jgi:hypothetical protein